MIGSHIWCCTFPFIGFTGPIYMKTVTIKSYDTSLKKKNHFKSYFNKNHLKWLVLRYCSPMEIQRAMQEPQNATVDILAVVAVMDASDRTPYYPDEIREVALMDGRYVSKLVFDGHNYAYFQYSPKFGTLWNGLGFHHIMLPDTQISESMLISCGMDNKFVLVQNVMVDQVSRDYYIIYLEEIFVPYMMY
jgi:hypothetical protein